jgi:hypothetical protein
LIGGSRRSHRRARSRLRPTVSRSGSRADARNSLIPEVEFVYGRLLLAPEMLSGPIGALLMARSKFSNRDAPPQSRKQGVPISRSHHDLARVLRIARTLEDVTIL